MPSEPLLPTLPAIRQLPLAGMMILTVEDSRFASEAMRLLAQRSGARLRRAETLLLAQRHLALYQPDVVIVDLGLPDGSGLDLIAGLARPGAFSGVLLATSGDPANREPALAAGAVAFVEKPIENLAGFQALILRHVAGWPCTTPGPAAPVRPDRQALRDDLARAAEMLERSGPERLPYILTFLRGIARISHDPVLEQAAAGAGRVEGGLPRLTHLLRHRLAAPSSPFTLPRQG